MKNSQNIDELLNGFIDDELAPRQRTEVQRLVKHDPEIADRLQQLQRCKELLGSLPAAQGPPTMLEDVKASLERRTLAPMESLELSTELNSRDQRRGARHLFTRQLLTTAAMLGLLAVLAGVIYNIVSPASTTETTIVADRPKPPEKVELTPPEQPAPTAVAAVEKPLEEPAPTIVATIEKPAPLPPPIIITAGFNCRLELSTQTLTTVDAAIKRAIEDNALTYTTPENQQAKNTYTVTCGPWMLNSLLADLQNIWSKFDSTALIIDTNRFGNQILINHVAVNQFVEIINRDKPAGRFQLAKDFAALNNIAERLPGRQILAAIDADRSTDLTTIPKPVLTSSEKTVKKSADQVKDSQKVILTIVVTGTKNTQ